MTVSRSSYVVMSIVAVFSRCTLYGLWFLAFASTSCLLWLNDILLCCRIIATAFFLAFVYEQINKRIINAFMSIAKVYTDELNTAMENYYKANPTTDK